MQQRCAPVVHELAFHGAASARAHPDFLAALVDPRLNAVVICPSNPFISIDRFLPCRRARGARRLRRPCDRGLTDHRRPRGKGPTAKMMAELGTKPSAGPSHIAITN